jgi:hypothetical protein
MKSVIYKNCKKCKQRTPHRVMENRKGSPMVCEMCEDKEKSKARA